MEPRMPKALPARPFPLFAGALALAATACDSGRATTFKLTIHPVPPPSQADLFDDIDTLVVRAVEEDGAATEWELPVERGTSPAIEDLDVLPDGITIELLGLSDGDLVARGTSGQLNVGRREKLDVDVFVAALGEVATFNELEQASWGTAVVSDGAGHFYLFGGTDVDWNSAALDAIDRWSLIPPDPSFAPIPTAGFPVTSDDWGTYVNEITGRMQATATLLSEGTHADAGKILVAGGWSSFQASASITAQLFLFDPNADPAEAIEVVGELKTGRAGHVAVPLGSGDVIFFGGYSHTDNQHISCPSTVEVYTAADRTSEYGSQMTEHCMVDGAGARLGDDAFYCGGAAWQDGSYGAYADCALVDRHGNLSLVEGPSGLDSAGLLLPAMARLGDDRILLSGGLEIDGDVDDRDWQDASARSFVYHAGTRAWQEVANMKVARAGHAAAALPDGRVLVTGGAARVALRGLWAEDPLPCTEIYDPADNSWTLLDSGCAAGSDVGSLPIGLYQPSIASDPYYGVLVWGGMATDLSGNLEAQPFYALFPPEPG